MGISFSLENQSQAIFRQLQKEYIVEEHPLSLNNPYIKTLINRDTAKRYILRIILTHTPSESSLTLNHIKLKQKSPPRHMVPLHTYYHQKVDFISGRSKDIYYLLFNLTGYVSLTCQIGKRKGQNMKFREEELIKGVNDIGRTLADLKEKTGKEIESHGNINSQSVFYMGSKEGGNFVLGDPLMAPPPSGIFIEKYPSPQHLMHLRNKDNSPYDPFVSDVFSLAMTILQASTLGLLTKIYSKTMINYDNLKLNLKRCPYDSLRNMLTPLLLGGTDARRQFLEARVDSTLFCSRKIKLLSSEKRRRSGSKSRPKAKIQLTTSRSKNKNNEQLIKPNVKMITSETCLTETTLNVHSPLLFKPRPLKREEPQMIRSQLITTTAVSFNYDHQSKKAGEEPVNYRNYFKQALQKQQKRAPFDPYEIEIYIARINTRLLQLQNDMTKTLKQNEPTYQSSKLSFKKSMTKSQHELPTQKSQDFSMCEYTIVIKEEEHSAIELPQTHKTVENSFNDSIFQESLIEKHSQKLKTSESDCIYQASYTINESKISSGNFSQERDSFQIRDEPLQVEDSASYAIHMKGTQLQVLSNLVIPEETASQEESLHEGEEKVEKGEYVDEEYQNGSHYRGYMFDGKRNGHGVHQYAQGGTYDGNWKDNRMSGYGKLYYEENKLAYEGTWHEDAFHGRGKVYNDNPAEVTSQFNYERYQQIEPFWVSYEGDFVYDCKQGYGKLLFSNGYEYHGQFQKDMPQGKGRFVMEKKQLEVIWDKGELVKEL